MVILFLPSLRASLRTVRCGAAGARKGLNGVTSNPFNRQVPRQPQPLPTSQEQLMSVMLRATWRVMSAVMAADRLYK